MTNSNDNNINKDERALEALLAAAFRLDFPEEISDEHAEILFQPLDRNHDGFITLGEYLYGFRNRTPNR